MSEPILEVRDLSKRFGELTVIDGISASFPDDSLYAVIGPNGAGKTTFFNLITGIIEPTEGEVIFNGDRITGMPPHEIAQRGLARSYQVAELFEQFTVFDNIRVAIQTDHSHYNFWQRTSDMLEVTEQAEAIVEKMNLEHVRDTPAGDLSHGEQRVLEIAIAIATNPQILLLDEPSSGVGPEETKKIIELINDISSDFPIILVEHKMSVVREVADYIMVLNYGEILANGPPNEVRNNEEVRRVYLGQQEL